MPTVTNFLSLHKPYFAGGVDKTVGGQIPPHCGMIQGMGTKYPKEAARLKAAMHERGYKTSAALSGALEIGDSRVRNWTNGTARPTVDEGIVIKRVLGITLDWLYEGDPNTLPYALYIRLAARMSGQTPADQQADEPVEAQDVGVASRAASPLSRAKRASAKNRS